MRLVDRFAMPLTCAYRFLISGHISTQIKTARNPSAHMLMIRDTESITTTPKSRARMRTARRRLRTSLTQANYR